MRFLRAALLLSVLTSAATAQSNSFAGLGVSYSPGASPAVAGTALYATALNTNGTYGFTVIDAVPSSVKPFSVTNQSGIGIAQRMFSARGISVYLPTAAGISWSGPNTGWAWSTGGMAVIPAGKTYRVLPSVRVVKSSVSAGAGYQLIGGLMFGWGW